MSVVVPDSVLMIGWEYPPHNSGGLGVACEGLTQALAGANTNIYFTLPYHHDQAVNHMQLINCVDPNFPYLQAPFAAYSSLKSAPLSATAQVIESDWQGLPVSDMEQHVIDYACQVYEHTTQPGKNFNVIHAHDWMSFPAALEVKKQTGKPLVAHIHSTEFDRIPNGQGSQYITQTERNGLHQADQVIAVSHYTKRMLTKMYDIPADKIQVVHNGVMPVKKLRSTPQFAQHRPVIVFMGRLTMQKGPEHFLLLAQHVLKKVPDALFVMAGHGDMYQELLLRTAAEKLTASVVFSGFLRDKQREMLLDRADVFVMPSLSEPFGLVAVEAAQRKTPVIVSKNVGVSEVMPSALQIDFWDREKMSAMIIELLNNRHQATRQIKAQLQDLKSVTWQNSARQVQEVYRKAFTGV